MLSFSRCTQGCSNEEVAQKYVVLPSASLEFIVILVYKYLLLTELKMITMSRSGTDSVIGTISYPFFTLIWSSFLLCLVSN
jgi:hypothetical protein